MKEGRVLVVDDEPMVRDTLGQMLSDEGYVVDLAIDGESALDRVHAARPDAILLDLMMPGMNGRQFLQTLRDDPSYEKVPVLVMTAVHGLEVNLATFGASEVVEKPFDADELLNKVALAVYRSRGPVNAPPPTPPVSQPPIDDDMGVVLVVERDRASLQQLDVALSAKGYTVVSMTRTLVQLSRLARALHPRAILLDLSTEGAHDMMSELAAAGLDAIPVLAFSRNPDAALPTDPTIEVLRGAADADLLAFVDRRRS